MADYDCFAVLSPALYSDWYPKLQARSFSRTSRFPKVCLPRQVQINAAIRYTG